MRNWLEFPCIKNQIFYVALIIWSGTVHFQVTCYKSNRGRGTKGISFFLYSRVHGSVTIQKWSSFFSVELEKQRTFVNERDAGGRRIQLCYQWKAQHWNALNAGENNGPLSVVFLLLCASAFWLGNKANRDLGYWDSVLLCNPRTPKYIN